MCRGWTPKDSATGESLKPGGTMQTTKDKDRFTLNFSELDDLLFVFLKMFLNI